MRVRVASQPTFTRYVFEMNDVIPVTTDRAKDALVVTFGIPLKFDLTDAKANMPPVLKSIEGFVDADASTVRFSFYGVADIRTFREDTNYVVDIGASDAKECSDGAEVRRPSGNGLQQRRRAAAAAWTRRKPFRPRSRPASRKPPRASIASGAKRRKRKRRAREKPAEAAPRNRRGRARAREPAAPAKKSAIEQPAAPAPQQQQMKLASARRPEQPQAAEAAAASEAEALATSRQEPAAPRQPATPAMPRAEARRSRRAPAENGGRSGRPRLPAKMRDPNSVTVDYSRQGENLALAFPFTAPTAAAIFRRADTIWLVFDTTASIDLNALQSETTQYDQERAAASRCRTGRWCGSSSNGRGWPACPTEGTTWIVKLGDTIAEPTRPLGVARNVAGSARATVTIPFDQPRRLYRVADPDIGDTLWS